jgi:FkbM family methyltransferase
MRTRIAVERGYTSLLRRIGLRDRVFARRLERKRSERLTAEASGDNSLSKPALHEIDAKLDAIIDRDGGFFIEAGANDGVTQSNTYWLEHARGWSGLLVEPMPELAAEARKDRPGSTVIQCALVAAGDPRTHLRMHFGDLMSMVDGAREADWPEFGTALGWRDPYELEVEARTLSSLLDEIGAPEVDLLSLDVEGFEEPALRGLDLARHAPRYILVELHNRAEEQPKVDAVLTDRYAEHGWLSPMDLLYVRRDLLDG